MILSNDGLVAFHYRWYGTFFLQQNRLHNIHRGFTHYKYYRAGKRPCGVFFMERSRNESKYYQVFKILIICGFSEIFYFVYLLNWVFTRNILLYSSKISSNHVSFALPYSSTAGDSLPSLLFDFHWVLVVQNRVSYPSTLTLLFKNLCMCCFLQGSIRLKR